MKVLVTVSKPLTGIEKIEIFEPETINSITFYPVKIDERRSNFVLDVDVCWKPIEPNGNLSIIVCLFVGDMINQLT